MIKSKLSSPQHFTIQYPTHSTHFQELTFLFPMLLIKQITHFPSLLKIIRISLTFKIHFKFILFIFLNY